MHCYIHSVLSVQLHLTRFFSKPSLLYVKYFNALSDQFVLFVKLCQWHPEFDIKFHFRILEYHPKLYFLKFSPTFFKQFRLDPLL